MPGRFIQPIEHATDSGASIAGVLDLSGAAIDMNRNNSDTRWPLFRFATFPIAQGEKLLSVKFSVFPFTLNVDDIDVDFWCEDVDDSADFISGSPVLPEDRVRTAATVAWQEDSLGASAYAESPELRTLFQEVIDRPGWSFDNAITLLAQDTQDAKRCTVWAVGDVDLRPILTVIHGPGMVMGQVL